MSDPLGPDNYRAAAQEAIKAYRSKGMLLDALLWGAVIKYYEAALEAHERHKLEQDETVQARPVEPGT